MNSIAAMNVESSLLMYIPHPSKPYIVCSVFFKS